MSDAEILTLAALAAYLFGLTGLMLCSLEPDAKRNRYYWVVVLFWPVFVLAGMFYSLLEPHDGMVGRIGVDDHGHE